MPCHPLIRSIHRSNDRSIHYLTPDCRGVIALRLADSALLPFDHEAQAKALAGYEQGLAAQQLDVANLTAAVAEYGKAAAKTASDVAALEQAGACDDASPSSSPAPTNDRGGGACAALNRRLSLTERRFLNPEGLPQRQWFKHTLQAPGLYLGYAAEAYPGVRQALDDGDLALAQAQVEVVAGRIAAAAHFLATGRDL